MIKANIFGVLTTPAENILRRKREQMAKIGKLVAILGKEGP